MEPQKGQENAIMGDLHWSFLISWPSAPGLSPTSSPSPSCNVCSIRISPSC